MSELKIRKVKGKGPIKSTRDYCAICGKCKPTSQMDMHYTNNYFDEEPYYWECFKCIDKEQDNIESQRNGGTT
jgi:hypothetical protein